MCFSAQASFVMGSVLIPLGLYTTVKAYSYNKHYLLIALIPVIFGIQQLIEGMVWLKWHQHDYLALYHDSLEYTFIAFFLWPVYLPLSVYFAEPIAFRKKVIGLIALFGFLLGILLYLPLLLGIETIDVYVINKSVSYNIDNLGYYAYFYLILYLISTVFPLLYCSIKEIKFLGLLLMLSAILAATIYGYAFTSTWCFFAAGLSLFGLYHLRHKTMG